MHPRELIERKRDGGALGAADLRGFLDGYLSGSVEDYQMSAMLMAIFYQGLDTAELREMTLAIIESGDRLDFTDGPLPAVDKHSTGGVGDKVSLILAPLLAEYGLLVPMMSGRGLGHSGGTLDKLESIPGFRTDLDLGEFRRTVEAIGCAMIGQTEEIAPLDGRLYALRDVTGTVESIPLIAASIVSKKVAEGIGGLVLDIKVGSGAFIRGLEDARRLGDTMVELAASLGLEASALLTGMDEPLGQAVGNALEVREAIVCLRGGGPADLREVTLALCATAAVDAGVAANEDDAASELGALLDNGRALERFARLVEIQGGDPRILDDFDRLPTAPLVTEFTAACDGYVAVAEARSIGQAAVALGAGRSALGQEIDPAVGLEVLCSVGDEVRKGDRLVRVHARDQPSASAALARLAESVLIADAAPAREPLVRDRIRIRSRR